jgi:hypothetical protein
MTMPLTDRNRLRALEGRQVSLSLADGSRLDSVLLVSAGRRGTGSVWIYAAGSDRFIPHLHLVDVWEAPPAAGRGQFRPSGVHEAAA